MNIIHMEKSKYENLSDGALKKFLNAIYIDFDNQTEHNQPEESVHKYNYKKIVTRTLKNFIPNFDDIDIDFFWAIFVLNFDKFTDGKIVGDIERPKCKEYRVVLQHTGLVRYSEYSAHERTSYSEESAKDVYNDDDFDAYSGDYFDYETGDNIDSNWELYEIDVIKENKGDKKIIKENLDQKISDLNLYQLIELQETIEKKIRERKKLIK